MTSKLYKAYDIRSNLEVHVQYIYIYIYIYSLLLEFVDLQARDMENTIHVELKRPAVTPNKKTTRVSFVTTTIAVLYARQRNTPYMPASPS